jgi:hypothetical protein
MRDRNSVHTLDEESIPDAPVPTSTELAQKVHEHRVIQ